MPDCLGSPGACARTAARRTHPPPSPPRAHARGRVAMARTGGGGGGGGGATPACHCAPLPRRYRARAGRRPATLARHPLRPAPPRPPDPRRSAPCCAGAHAPRWRARAPRAARPRPAPAHLPYPVQLRPFQCVSRIFWVARGWFPQRPLFSNRETRAAAGARGERARGRPPLRGLAAEPSTIDDGTHSPSRQPRSRRPWRFTFISLSGGRRRRSCGRMCLYVKYAVH